MARIKIELPEHFSFTTTLTVRITDLNYGGHVGNDHVLSFLHEARVRFLQALGYTELGFAGVSLILADAAIVYKNEMYYGDELMIHVQATEIGRAGFDLVYKVEKKTDTGPMQMVLAKTAMVCFDYTLKKVVALPEEARIKMS